MSTDDLGLTETQRAWARRIVARIKSRGFGADGPRIADIALATALVESGLYMWANKGNPESLALPHDEGKVGSDFDSVGLYQQRPKYWGTTAELMDVDISTDKFVDALRRINWKGMPPGAAAQKVQVSAFPDRYAQRMDQARQIRTALWNEVEEDMPLNDSDKKWLKTEIAKSVWTYRSVVNKLKFGDMLRVLYTDWKYGKRGVRHHGRATADEISRLGAIELELKAINKKLDKE